MAKEPNKDLWIGLSNAKGGQFYWTDGRPMKYNNWGFANRHHHRLIFHRPSRYDYDLYTYHLEMHRNTILREESNTCAAMTTDTKIGIGKWEKKSCNDTTGYVCLRNVDASLPDSPEPTTTDYVKIFNDSIKVVTKQMTWQEAKKHCEDDGAKLANLRNEWTRVHVELMAIKAPLWIGLNKMETSGYYRYIDGWPVTKPNWDALEPRMNQPCVFVNADGKWKTADCNQNMTSVCMKSTDVPPTVSSDFPGNCPDDPETSRWQRNSWLPFKGHCYLFLTERVEWPDASANCVRHGGSLASIEDPSEQAFLQSSINRYKDEHTTFWIGLYKTHKGMWMWLDKTAMDYTNWDEGQYISNSYGAIQIADGRWTTARSRYHRPYICKTSKVSHPAPTILVSPRVNHQSRGHIILAVVLVITAIAIGLVIVLFLFKKSGHRLPIPEKLTTFDNPLFFNNEQSHPDLVDTNKLVANAEEETPGPVKTV